MYDSQNIAFLIKKTAKEKNITIKQLLETCNLNINTISELSKGKQISYLNFATIADCLDVSVDYLLGREKPQMPEVDPTTKVLIEHFNKLSPQDKIDILNLVLQKAS